MFLAIVPVMLAGLLHSPAGSESWAGPSPNTVFQFQKDNQSHPWLRITTDSGRVERKVLRLDDAGLHGISTREGVRLPESIAWSRIGRIDEVLTGAGPWSKVGTVTLGLLGAGLGNALGAPSDRGGTFAVMGLMVFGGAGGYAGSRFGSRFRSERNWYIADTTRHVETVAQIESPSLEATPVANRAVLRACDRIGRNERFRAHGAFGSFEGYADIAGPQGLESLHAHRPRAGGPAVPQRITWDQIDRVEVRGGSAMRGALVGGATFAAVGAVLGMAAIALSEGTDVSVGGGAALGALYVAPVGIGLGGLSGLAIRRWVRVYQRP